MTRFPAALAVARMTAVVLVAAAVVVTPRLARAEIIGDGNSTLELTLNPGPVQLPQTLEWTVDGRRILVYPSGPSHFLDVGDHLHDDAHVAANQMHAQGTLLGHQGVFGGIVYAVDGGEMGSGASRIYEKVDIFNGTDDPVTLSLYGLGFRPTRAGFEVPDLVGLRVVGTTVVFTQGDTGRPSIVFPPFGPVTVLPVISFSGFNPLFNQVLSLSAGATLTMITELKVGSPPPPVLVPSPVPPLPPPLPPAGLPPF